MTPRLLLVLALPLAWPLAGCGGAVPIPAADVAIRLQAPDAADFGQPFVLTVVRQHRVGLQPQPIPPQALAPLSVQPESSAQRRVGDMVELADRYRAFAFATGELVVPPVSFAALPRGGGAAAIATSAPLRLTVRSLLPPGDAGRPELPSGLLELPGTPWRSAGPWLAAAAVALALVVWWRQRLAPRLVAARTPQPSPLQLAQQRLAQLRMRTDDVAAAAFYVEASLLLRQFLEQRFCVRALEMTSDELLQAAASGDLVLQQQRQLLRELLAQCDLVKFAGLQPSPPQRLQALEQIAAVLQQSGEASDAGP